MSTLINIVGLSIGIASCIFIMMYVSFEVSYDNYHEDLNRIYRIPMKKESESRKVAWPTNTAALAPVLKDHFSEVESVGRLYFGNNILLRYNNKSYSEDNVALADQDILNILTIKFVKGDKATALIRPKTTILTKSTAIKYFGDEDPIGKIILSDYGELEVTAIVEDSPQNTHMKFNLLVAMIFQQNPWWINHWPTASCYTYVKLNPGVDIPAFEKQISDYANSNSQELQKRGERVFFNLQPVKNIHLHSKLEFEKEPPGNLVHLYIFSVVGLLILFISCINFINLTTAKYTFRIKEVGVRKTIGAKRIQIVIQLLIESIALSLIALVFAAIIVERFIPYINNLIGIRLKLDELLNGFNIIYIIVFSLLTGVLAGIYPALTFSSFRPAFAVRNPHVSGKKVISKKILIIGQFVISITLIILSLTIYKQIRYMQLTDLGLKLDKKLIIQLPNSNTVNIADRYEMIKEEFKKLPIVTGASFSSHVPGEQLSTNKIWPTGRQIEEGMSIKFMRIDHDFLQDYDIEIIRGRTFMKEMESDKFMGSVIINEAMMKACGWDSPEEALGHTFYDPPRPIIGVTNNFHFRGLQHEVEPIYMNIWPERFSQLTLCLQTNDLSTHLTSIETKYKELFPNTPFEYFFLDELFKQQYMPEEKLAGIFRLFTILAILLSCLGMYGLASYIAEQRTKEIGIRKTFGANQISILIIVSKEFLSWIIIGSLLACPISFILIDRWLQNFALKVPNTIWVYIISITLALIVAIVSVFWQSLSAARKNPVESLRYE